MGEMLGYTVDEMLGRHLFSFMDERGIEVAKQLLEHRRLGITEQHDFEFLKKDGSRIYVIIETSPITDEGGNYVGALAGVMDMTEHREMEKKLREYADNLETLVNERTEETRFLSNIASSIEQAVFVQDNDRGIIYVNKAFDDMYGYRAEGVIGRHASMLFPTVQDADRVNHEITESLENDGHWIGEAFKRRKNGEV
jgi:PAS domain S-box-containing protein